MDERDRGLVLRVFPLTETSLIVHWLTREAGRIATIAKGALRPKSPFRGKLDLFYLADLSFVRSRRSDLHTLRELSLRETHPALRRELGFLEQAAYCAALVEQSTERDTPLPAVFNLMIGLLQCLPAQSPEPQTLLGFELKLLTELGLRPNLDKTSLSPGAVQLVRALTERDWPMIARLKFSPPQITELSQFLHGFLIYHLGKIPKGRAAALRG